jgi:hypothetical protein
MRHLNSEELVDLAEGTAPEASFPHLQSCDGCRRQLADLRAVMSAAADVDVPEPSPLFWDHFSARVHEAVAAEGAPSRLGWLGRWNWHTLTLPLAAGALAAVVLGVALTLSIGRGRGPAASGSMASTAGNNSAAATDVADPALDLVADLAMQVDWESEATTTLRTHEAASARAVSQLSDGERRELRRLLQKELGGRAGD